MPKKCLVVDDNVETVDIVSFILKKAGYEVLTAYDGEQGLKVAQENLPDLILLDLMMPVMDGYTMNEHLKEDPRTKNIPVIIATAKGGMEPMFENTKGAPIQGYLVKPFSQKELLNRIDALLGKA
jgi:CheY-like chemotaxis protein